MAPKKTNAEGVPVHALNILIPEFDWYRMLEVVALRGQEIGNASDVARLAIKELLDNHPHADFLNETAQARMEFAQEAERQRNEIRAHLAQPTD